MRCSCFLYLTPHLFPPHPGSLNISSCKRLDPPVFVEPLEDCCVDEGADIKLRGVITGSQPIKVSWLHNGEQGHCALLHLHVCLGFDRKYTEALAWSLKTNLA